MANNFCLMKRYLICSELNLTRGNPETWAAAIAYAFARMNFLLDDDGPLHIDRSTFFDFFTGGSRSTVTQKATRIEKALHVYHGHPDFCLPEIVDAMPRMVQLPNGMIAPGDFLSGTPGDGPKIGVSFLNEEESVVLEQQLQERERAWKEEQKGKRHEALRRKREEERKSQPELFDLGD